MTFARSYLAAVALLALFCGAFLLVDFIAGVWR